MCDIWKNGDEGELVSDEWVEVISQLARWLGVFHLTITGGEPFMKRGIWRILDHAVGLGIPTAVVTNGYCFNARKLDRLTELDLGELIFSFDGPDGATHDEIRGVQGSFDRARDAFADLARRPRRRFVLGTSTVVVRSNVHRLGDVARRLADLGSERIFFQPVQSGFTWTTGSEWPYGTDLWPDDSAAVNRTIDELHLLTERGLPIANTHGELETMRRYLTEGGRFRRVATCRADRSNLELDAYGNARMCIPFKSSIGNVRETAPELLWRSDAADSQRDDIAACVAPCLLNCNREPSRRSDVASAVRFLGKKAGVR
jgi:MoaA/NifB/PqqE/SkfB family radical SAM enzyme